MGFMPGNVSKGRELRAFEEFINDNPQNLKDALKEYEKPASEIDELMDFATFLRPVDRGHIRAHWFPEAAAKPGDPAKNPYWPIFEPMGKVIQAGLIRALKTCQKKVNANGTFGAERAQYLPIDVHWVCAGKAFEVVVTLGIDFDNGTPFDHHVNMLILTPALPTTRRGEVVGDDLQDENIWTVQHQDLGPAEKEVARDPDKSIVTARLTSRKD